MSTSSSSYQRAFNKVYIALWCNNLLSLFQSATSREKSLFTRKQEQEYRLVTSLPLQELIKVGGVLLLPLLLLRLLLIR